MEFKVGDKIKIRRGRSNCSQICQDKIRRIAEVHQIYFLLDCNHGGIYRDEAIFIKNLPKTEVDFLDCFQANFKEGV